MKDILSIIINSLFVINLVVISFYVIYYSRPPKIYIFPLLITIFCWILGEYFWHQGLSTPGFAIYGIGNVILLLSLHHLFGGTSSIITIIFLFLICLISFTGYFWPENLQGEDKINIVCSIIFLSTLAIAVIFAVNITNNSRIYSAIFFTDAALNLTYLISYNFFGIRTDMADHYFIIIEKGIIIGLCLMLIYRFFIQKEPGEKNKGLLFINKKRNTGELLIG